MSRCSFRVPVAVLVMLFAVPSLAGPQFFVVLQGYDAVSFFDSTTARKCRLEHSVYWNGTTWLLESAENAERFRREPTAYAPQFDGYCALAAALGYKAPSDPLTGNIVNGNLYLNFNSDKARIWNEDTGQHSQSGGELAATEFAPSSR